jgi:hypothetical protein
METHECVPAESRFCTGCLKEKPLAEFYKKGKAGFFSKCKQCCSEQGKVRYLENREVKLQKCAERRARKKDEIREYHKAYYVENKDKLLAQIKDYRSRPEVKEKERKRLKEYYAARSEEIQRKRKAARTEEQKLAFHAYLKKHYESNRAAYAAKCGKRRASKLNATPSWADLKAIKAVYAEARRVSLETGVLHHVDHVVPLQGKLVCGLHVHYNLQVIPAKDNLSKATKVEDIVRHSSESRRVEDKELLRN